MDGIEGKSLTVTSADTVVRSRLALRSEERETSLDLDGEKVSERITA